MTGSEGPTGATGATGATGIGKTGRSTSITHTHARIYTCPHVASTMSGRCHALFGYGDDFTAWT